MADRREAGRTGDRVADRGEAGRVARRWRTGVRPAGWGDNGGPGRGQPWPSRAKPDR